jgi:uroporphyrinogen-III decarboxylase
MDQQEMLVEMYTEPDALHGFLEKVAAHLIRYGKTCHEAAGGKVPGNGWPAAFFPAELGAAFTEDLMPLLSPEKYAEFGIPQLRRFGDAFGGMLIHCCGQWGQHAQNLADSGLPIRAIEFHHPHTTLEQIKPLAEQGVVLIPYLAMNLQDEYDSVIAFYEHLLAETPYRYWFVFHNDTEDAVAFAEKHAV